MEIVPIIYATLIVVVVLTIFTLIFSFYSLKKRQRDGYEIPIKQSVPVQEIPTPKSIPVQNNSFLKKSENLKPISILSPKKIIPVKGEKKNKSKSKIGSELKKTRNAKHETDSKKKLIRNSRLEVLNTIFDNTDKINKDEIVNLKSLDNNILDNYTDEEKNDMFTLKVKDQDDKPKNKP